MHGRISRRGFTLIELLVVIAIIAILAVVVVLTLNPAELLRQSRDSSRISDMATLNSAISLYQTDQNGAPSFNLGTSSVVYVSIPDMAATSTLGTDCAGINLLSGGGYHCPASSTQRSINAQGWIPINLSLISSGSPLSSLPEDPTNSTSSGYYYLYATNSSQYEVIAPLESQKYKTSIQGSFSTGIATQGSMAGAGLAGWWNFEEGSGSSTVDSSGSNNNGTWLGTASGANSTYYTTAKVGSYSGYFNGSNNYVTTPLNFISLDTAQAWTISAWINTPPTESAEGGVWGTGGSYTLYRASSSPNLNIYWAPSSLPVISMTANQWTMISVSRLGNIFSQYKNGALLSTTTVSAIASGSNMVIGGEGTGHPIQGSIDSVRIYSRALSAAEVQALYNAEK